MKDQIQFETNGLTVLAVVFIILLSAVVYTLIESHRRLKADLLKSERLRVSAIDKHNTSIKKEFRLGDKVFIHKDDEDEWGRDNTPYWIYEFYTGLQGDYLAKLSPREDWEGYSKTTSSVSISNAIRITDISHVPVECCTKCGKVI
jgi:hypothetical protein